MAKAARQLIVCKGKRVRRFEPGGVPSDEMVDAMLGATGNLRAPTLRIGDLVVVGYNDKVFDEVFG